MLTPIDLHASHAIGFAIDGTITSADIATLNERLSAAASDGDRVRLYVELRSFPSLGGVSDMVKLIRTKLDAIDKVDKYAIVTDKGWVEPLASVAGYALSSMEMHVFPLAKAGEAQSWLVNDEAAPAPPASIERVEFFDEPNVVGVVINGKLRKPDYAVFNRLINEKPDATSMYVEIRAIKGLELNGIMNELRSELKTLDNFEKCAIVGYQAWLPAATRVADWLTPNFDVRYFDLDDVVGAQQWLGVKKNRGTGLAPA